LGLRLWLVWHTEVAARDSIGYIRYAWQLSHQPWREVIRTTEQPPGYALAIVGASYVVRNFIHAPESIVMQLGAQLASALAGVLLVVPMFFLGKELFNRGVGFWASLFIQAFPSTGRILSDGLSESLFLLFAATALLLAARALRLQSPIRFALCGLFGGLAYLTRTEGGLLIGSTGLVLIGSQATRAWRMPWRRWLVCGTALSFVSLLIACPYMAVIGRLTNKQSHRSLLEGRLATSPNADLSISSPQPRAPHANVSLGPALPPLAIISFAVWSNDTNHESPGSFWWGLRAVMTELGKGSFEVGWVPVFLALWWFRGLFREVPGAWVLLVVSLALILALWRLAAVMGYISDRHAILVLLCGSYWTVAGLGLIGSWLASAARYFMLRESGGTPGWRRLMCDSRMVSIGLMILLVAIALPKTLETLHSNRAGLRDAGLWLLEHADPSDRIVDPYYWSHYYAGRVFQEGAPGEPPAGHRRMRYVVLEFSRSKHPRLEFLHEAKEAAKTSTPCFRWTGKQDRTEAKIVVYAAPWDG
jgi:hypothetical protein